MKVISTPLFEKGDYVQVTSGYNKGRLGIVQTNQDLGDEVEYRLVDKDYGNDEDDWDRDTEDEESPAKYLRYLTKTEYEKALKDAKILRVDGLAVHIQYKGANLLIGDNVITKVNALKIAEFIITNNSKTTKRKRA